MNSLAPINFFQHHSSISHTRQHGTGQWLLDDPHFQEWQSSAGRTLWLSGIRMSSAFYILEMPIILKLPAGAGKTVLTYGFSTATTF
jgi:hypothetical protein